MLNSDLTYSYVNPTKLSYDGNKFFSHLATVIENLIIARLSQRVWTTTLRGRVNQELKLLNTHFPLKWLGCYKSLGVVVQRSWLNLANLFKKGGFGLHYFISQDAGADSDYRNVRTFGETLNKIGKPGNFEEVHFFPVSAPETCTNNLYNIYIILENYF